MSRFLVIFILLVMTPGAKSEDESFAVYDLFLDSGSQPLAAYQLEVRAPRSVKFVGVEGGKHIAFQRPPFHDPKAIQKNRIKLAAFSARPPEKLPSGETRIASLHVQIIGSISPEFHVELEVASNHKAEKIKCTLQIKKRKTEASEG